MSIIEYKFEQYNSLAPSQYKKEKYNLQVELLKLQEDVISNKRKIAICREMTKVHEEIIRGDLESILQRIVSGSITLKGEIVIVVERIGTDSNEFALNDEVRNEVLKKLSPSEAAKLISLMTNHKRRDIYDWLKKS